jgi:hypothetical protein
MIFAVAGDPDCTAFLGDAFGAGETDAAAPAGNECACRKISPYRSSIDLERS